MATRAQQLDALYKHGGIPPQEGALIIDAIESASDEIENFTTEAALTASVRDQGTIAYAEDTDTFWLREETTWIRRGHITGVFTSPGAGANSERFGSGAAAAGANGTALGNTASASGADSTAVGSAATASLSATSMGRSSSAGGDNAVALGKSTNASAADTTVVGANAAASVASSTAVGKGASASGGGPSTAIGAGAATSAANTTSVGFSSAASVAGATAYGDAALATAADAVAVGKSSAASGARSIALGRGASDGGFADAIALGKDAAAPGANRGRVGTAVNPISWEGFADLDWVGGYAQTLGPWLQDNVAALQTAVALAVGTTPTRNERIVTRGGSIIGVVVLSNEARTAGTMTVEVTKNGVGTGLTAVLDATNTTFKATTQAKDADTFVAGDRIGAIITTDATWAPTTADITVEVLIEQ